MISNRGFVAQTTQGDDPAGPHVPVLNPIKLPDKATPGEANSVRTVGFWPARIFSSNDPLKVVGC